MGPALPTEDVDQAFILKCMGEFTMQMCNTLRGHELAEISAQGNIKIHINTRCAYVGLREGLALLL